MHQMMNKQLNLICMLTKFWLLLEAWLQKVALLQASFLQPAPRLPNY
jgi:hypothetical protein